MWKKHHEHALFYSVFKRHFHWSLLCPPCQDGSLFLFRVLCASGPLVSGWGWKGERQRTGTITTSQPGSWVMTGAWRLPLRPGSHAGGIRRLLRTRGLCFSLVCVTQSLNDWFKLPKLLPSVQNIYRCNDLIFGKLRSFALSKGRNCILPSSCLLSLLFHTRRLPILRAL